MISLINSPPVRHLSQHSLPNSPIGPSATAGSHHYLKSAELVQKIRENMSLKLLGLNSYSAKPKGVYRFPDSIDQLKCTYKMYLFHNAENIHKYD